MVVFGYACSTRGCLEGIFNPNQVNMMCLNCGHTHIKESHNDADTQCSKCGENSWIDLYGGMNRSIQEPQYNTQSEPVETGCSDNSDSVETVPSFDLESMQPALKTTFGATHGLTCPRCKTGVITTT